ncbi:MAG: response regulator [Thermoguttaceae bacterium]|nr:response regulator [Thermoguttaceae bacterium]
MNTFDELRKMAERVLVEHPRDFSAEELGGNFKKLLEELSICQIELEHQNRELERSEKMLAEARQEYVKLFESMPLSYVILDEDRCLIKANESFVTTFASAGTQTGVTEGSCFDELVTSEFRNAFVVFCKMAQTKKTPIPMELKLIDHKDSSRDVLLNVLLTARAYDMEKREIAMTISDISMRKAMEEQLARVKNEEANASRQKSNFLTNVSHELRSPLATIVGYKEIVTSANIPDSEKIECCREVIATCEVLQHFADRVLDVSALENGTTPIRCQVVDMEKLCSNVVLAFTRSFRQKNTRLNVHLSNIPKLWSDPLRLTQIISSVLEHVSGNVVEGEIDLSIAYISGYDAFGTLRLTFSGHEIFSSDSDFIRQSDLVLGAARDSVSMVITKRIVDAMNGLLVWEHPLNTLRIDIPVALSSKTQIAKHEAAGCATDPDLPKTKTCLLVDDVEMNLKILGIMMKKLGYTPTQAHSGQEAKDLASTRRFDIVLTDLWMPEIDGEDLAIALRQNPDYDKVPVYAVTADVEYDSNFNMSFFAVTIIKPVSLEQLKKIVVSVDEKAEK